LIIAALLLAALSVETPVFPDPMCEKLPEVGPEVKTWVAQVAPELAQVRVRALPVNTALDIFGRAAAAGWGSVDLLTQSVFREPCTFYFSREALRAVDAAFELDLVTVIRGQDTKGQDFEMTALLAGRGKLVVFYERDGIVYRNARLARDFKLASRIEFETPAAGVLENVQGLCAKVVLFGCVRVRSLVKVGDTLKVLAGSFTSGTLLKPIQPRDHRAATQLATDLPPRLYRPRRDATAIKDCPPCEPSLSHYCSSADSPRAAPPSRRRRPRRRARKRTSRQASCRNRT
jgi:hypothetical protein